MGPLQSIFCKGDVAKLWIEKMTDRINARNVEVQVASCEALSRMAANKYNGKVHRARIGELGGVECIMELMRNFPTNEVVLRAGCRALWKLAHDADNAERIRLGKGVELLEKTARDFYDDEYILEDSKMALETIKDMGSHLAHAAIRVGEKDTDPGPIINAMKEHPQKADVQEHGCEVLLDFVRDEEQFKIIRDIGGLDVLAAILEKHLWEEGLLIKTFCLIARLGKNVENCAIFGKRGVIEQALRAIRLYPTSEALEKEREALEAKRRTAKNKNEFVTDYGWKKQQQSIWVLNQLVRNDKNRARLIGLDGVQSVRFLQWAAKKEEQKIIVPLVLRKLIEECTNDDDDEDNQ